MNDPLRDDAQVSVNKGNLSKSDIIEKTYESEYDRFEKSSKGSYCFYKIPKVVFSNPNLSPCSKLLLSYLLSREAYYVNKEGYPQGSFFHCYLKTLANKVGKSADSVRKKYIPELIAEGYIDKKNVGGKKDDKRSTKCFFCIKWESILGTETDEKR